MTVSAVVVRCTEAAEYLIEQAAALGLTLRIVNCDVDDFQVSGPSGEAISVSVALGAPSMIEQTLRQLAFDFDELPQLVRGDSKDIRLLTPSIALARLLPTVYSFTHNRYGEVPGTAELRARFSADMFRAMAARPGRHHLSSTFLGLVESSHGPLLAEEVIEDCNLEVRVKRFHIGSPIHRYRYTDRHATVSGPPLTRWTRFATPVVCFDWRHPLHSDEGDRLADEPISDDYAGIWMRDVARAKALARDTFSWLEELFAQAGLHLIDICFFIDRSGTAVYGEISPDCMRVRSRASDDADALDKDEWRSGGDPEVVLRRYQTLYDRIKAILNQ
jgi:phosphoribosylaminoimidazole-succinocarboxamide synthase